MLLSVVPKKKKRLVVKVEESREKLQSYVSWISFGCPVLRVTTCTRFE